MKSVSKKLLCGSILTIYLLLLSSSASAQGKIVVNEFMAWSASGGSCPANSEFIELMNFGPGPMNIGCYIVTNGKFAVTIPPNTVLKAGQYYVLAGVDVLTKGCANTDSAVRVNLNWSTCGCITPSAPPTSDGYLQDGGGANEKVVILDPNRKVVDAVSRSSTPSSSAPLTTQSGGGGCSSWSFDLDTMAISYESIGASQGTGNSYSRKVDGDCGWMKTPSISAGASNKTGSTSSATYSFSTISASECAEKAGWISIQVSATNVASLFPMSYTLAYDADSNGVYNDRDVYTYGVDSSAPSIDISSLAYGRYRMTVASVQGCNLKTFDFFIFNCYGVMVLPLKLLSFSYEGQKGGQYSFAARFSDVQDLQSLTLEGAGEDNRFYPLTNKQFPASPGETSFQLLTYPDRYDRYRLRITGRNGEISYSQVVRVLRQPLAGPHSWPNPVTDKLFVVLSAAGSGLVGYTVLGATGTPLMKGHLAVAAGTSTVSVPTAQLASGVYYLRMEGEALSAPLTVRFMK